MIGTRSQNPSSVDRPVGYPTFPGITDRADERPAVLVPEYPTHPPRVRLEWLIATARVVLAGGAFFAGALSPVPASNSALLNLVLGWYLLYSVVVLGLVWTPVRFAAGWDLAVHIFDLIAFSLLSFLMVGTTSPFYLYFSFLVICGTLRWESWGAFWTTAAAIGAYAGLSWYGHDILSRSLLTWDVFAIRSIHLAVVAALVAYMGAYQQRYQAEIAQLASWPRKLPTSATALISEVLSEAAEILEAPRMLIVWEEPGSGDLNLAWHRDGELIWAHESEETYGSLVSPWLEGKSFQTSDAASEHAVVTLGGTRSFLKHQGRSVDPALQERFNMHAVQSWTLDGEMVRGRLFGLDKPQMRLDELGFGLLVARLAVSRLDSLYLLKRLQDATALDERLRLSRDLHDSLIQSVAGSALQLLAARRLLERDPAAANKRLEDVQNQLERGELEMRTFIGRLRPLPTPVRPLGTDLTGQLEELRQRIETEWEVGVRFKIHQNGQPWPEDLKGEMYRIIQEGVLNAARHADASVIDVSVEASDSGIEMSIADDGRGFPFQGTYDLAALNEAHQGPWTLKERVADLRGDLTLTSTTSGTALQIHLPLGTQAR